LEKMPPSPLVSIKILPQNLASLALLSTPVLKETLRQLEEEYGSEEDDSKGTGDNE
jgi:hypothetical protein